MRTSRIIALAAGVALVVVVPQPAAAGSATFTLSDPRGDDHGDGSLVYPFRDDLQPGDLDLVSLSARPDKDGTRFEAVFARPIAPTARRTIDRAGTTLDDVARFGFYTFNLDIYIDTDHEAESGSLNMLPGRVAQLDPANAWEKAVVLTPRPYEARTAIARFMMRTVKRDRKEEGQRLTEAEAKEIEAEIERDVESRVFFPTQITVQRNKVSFVVPDAFLGGPARPDWSYVVAVTACDIEQKFDVPPSQGIVGFRGDNLMVVPLGLSPSRETLGGGREYELDFMPPLVDIIVPAGTDQESLLRNYDVKTGRPVRLPGVVPAQAATK